jgi:hypothetical protein
MPTNHEIIRRAIGSRKCTRKTSRPWPICKSSANQRPFLDFTNSEADGLQSASPGHGSDVIADPKG